MILFRMNRDCTLSSEIRNSKSQFIHGNALFLCFLIKMAERKPNHLRHFGIRAVACVRHTLKQLGYILADGLEVFSRIWQWILNTFGKWRNWWSAHCAFLYCGLLLTNTNLIVSIVSKMQVLILLDIFRENLHFPHNYIFFFVSLWLRPSPKCYFPPFFYLAS